MNSLPAQPPSPDSGSQSKTRRRGWIIWIVIFAGIGLLMLFKERYSPAFANRIVRGMLESYLKGRRDEDEAA